MENLYALLEGSSSLNDNPYKDYTEAELIIESANLEMELEKLEELAFSNAFSDVEAALLSSISNFFKEREAFFVRNGKKLEKLITKYSVKRDEAKVVSVRIELLEGLKGERKIFDFDGLIKQSLDVYKKRSDRLINEKMLKPILDHMFKKIGFNYRPFTPWTKILLTLAIFKYGPLVVHVSKVKNLTVLSGLIIEEMKQRKSLKKGKELKYVELTESKLKEYIKTCQSLNAQGANISRKLSGKLNEIKLEHSGKEKRFLLFALRRYVLIVTRIVYEYNVATRKAVKLYYKKP